MLLGNGQIRESIGHSCIVVREEGLEGTLPKFQAIRVIDASHTR